MKNILNKINYSMLSVILFLLISIITLFIPPIIGMADNGDYYRIISQNDLYHLPKENEDIFFGYFNKSYGIYKYNNELETTLISTQSTFIKLAIFIDKLITKDDVFDIRFLSIIYIIIQAVALYFISRVLLEDINNKKYKVILVFLITIIFSDTAYIAYYNSFYGESVNICCFLYSIGIFLYMCKFNKFNINNLILFGISTYLLLGSKQQLSPIGILASILLVRVIFLKRDIKVRIVSIILIIFLITNSVYFYKSIKGDFDYINRYHAITRGVLLYEERADEILNNFDIYNQYSLLQNEIFFEKIPMINPDDERLKEDFYSKYSVFGILLYYIKNPKALIKMCDLAFKNSYSIRPKVMGNYEKSEGKAYGKRSNFFVLWSSFKESIMPKGFIISVIYIFIYLIFSYKKYIKAFKLGNLEGLLFEEGLLYALIIGLSQIFISIIGAGDADLSKHVFMYNLSFDLMIVCLLSNIISKKDSKGRIK
ncbi:hypothetical protein [Clostridium sp. C8]|uniref:glycan biosynthesis hexose transferase WsfD n=1 Tax=Clostridium sp. C8 TaxID=1667357 RepID=UPI00062E4F0D|nr:hypothetical protein [Clostridium sp. C8]KLE16658.1 membrane protein [Clostridium sp. C8]